MAMIKCPECGHHISSMAKTCPECGCPIDPEWAAQEAEKAQLKAKNDAAPFTVESNGQTVKDTEATQQAPVQPAAAPQQPQVPQTPQPTNKSRRWGIVGGLVVLIIILIGGYIYLDNRQDAIQEERDYEMLEGCNNPAFYEDFIVKYPNSKYIEDVRSRYREVSAANDEWDKVRVNCNRQELEDYAHLHPGSPYVSIARDMIDSLDYFSARNQNTVESMQKYMEDHPEGHYYGQAESLAKSLQKKKEEARRDSIASAAASLADSAVSAAVNVAKQFLQ